MRIPQNTVVNLPQAIERIYGLNVGIIGHGGDRHERPHKPLLLLAVLDLIDEGLATPDRIPWSQELRDRFATYFRAVHRHDDKNTPENPFHYLQSEGFWQAWTVEGNKTQPLGTTPRVNQIGHAFARFTDGFDQLVSNVENRLMIREALVSRYFPHAALQLAPIIPSLPAPALAEEETEYGRSPAFRRKIIEIYDHQCAACGLRILLPIANEISFIDAAHLIPFSESRNDHPTNGLALCKNHHWAMDRNLIAPAPDHRWNISAVLDPRRSNGEKELAELSGKTLLLPKDEAFHPDRDGLEWRLERLIA